MTSSDQEGVWEQENQEVAADLGDEVVDEAVDGVVVAEETITFKLPAALVTEGAR